MKALYKLFVVLLASIGLASCGGGGGGSNTAFGGAPAYDISISASPSSITTNSFTTLTVTVKNPGGANAQDGTAVSASVSPANIGTISASGGSAAATASTTVTGGVATFIFNSSNQVGTAHISVTVAGSSNKALDLNVTAGNGQDPRLKLTASATTMPLNPFGGATSEFPFPGNYIGSPFVAEVTVTWRHSNGQLVTGTTPVNVSIDPTAIAGFSTLDDPTTPWPDHTKADGNEFLLIFGSGPVNVTGGNGVIFVHDFNTPGTTTLTVTAIDPDNGQTISSQLEFTVVGAATTLPTSISAFGQGAAYISSSGGAQSSVVNAIVTDGNDALIPDPAGFDTVEFEIVGPAGTDARLSGINAAGQSITGTKVDTATHSGIAAVTFEAGSQQGPVQIRATADRGDGNVDNGIQDPVSSTTTVVVSDGRLYSLSLTWPGTNAPAILVNRVSTQATLTSQGTTIPPDPDATYSFTVSAIGNDRQGNPVLPGTVIRFGSIDSPVDDAGNYQISGAAGDPLEGGTLFTATDGHFTTAGGGAGPGDTLLVFGKLADGNADLESADKIASIQNAQTLHVQNPFNWNDTTGNSVNYGPVLPYIIGRAQIGNITSPAGTNNVGVASTTLNYPVSALGHVTAVWAQGDGVNTATHSGSTDIVTDIALVAFPGVAPATITISPNPIPGNLSTEVDVCIVDKLGSPISGVAFTFQFSGLGVGAGSVDGISTAGTVPQVTDVNGCVATTVNTSGIAASSSTTGGPTLTFRLGTASAAAPITASGPLVLIARPSAFANGVGGSVTLTLLSANGTPVANVLITGTCTSDNGSLQIIGSAVNTTDANGQVVVKINGALNEYGKAGSGSCTFTTSSGSPTAVVTVNGVDLCTLTGGSGSPPPQCGTTTTPPTSSTLALVIKGTAATDDATATITPGNLSCSGLGAASATCTETLTAGTYTITPTIRGGTFVGWTGNCTPASSGQTATLVVPSTAAALSCTLNLQ